MNRFPPDTSMDTMEPSRPTYESIPQMPIVHRTFTDEKTLQHCIAFTNTLSGKSITIDRDNHDDLIRLCEGHDDQANALREVINKAVLAGVCKSDDLDFLRAYMTVFHPGTVLP